MNEGEKERVSRLEMLDELEEWELLAAHYTVVWAWQGETLYRGAFQEWESKCPGQRPYAQSAATTPLIMESIEA